MYTSSHSLSPETWLFFSVLVRNVFPPGRNVFSSPTIERMLGSHSNEVPSAIIFGFHAWYQIRSLRPGLLLLRTGMSNPLISVSHFPCRFHTPWWKLCQVSTHCSCGYVLDLCPKTALTENSLTFDSTSFVTSTRVPVSPLEHI